MDASSPPTGDSIDRLIESVRSDYYSRTAPLDRRGIAMRKYLECFRQAESIGHEPGSARALVLIARVLGDAKIHGAGPSLLLLKARLILTARLPPGGPAPMFSFSGSPPVAQAQRALYDELLPKVKSGSLSASDLVRMFVEGVDLSPGPQEAIDMELSSASREMALARDKSGGGRGYLEVAKNKYLEAFRNSKRLGYGAGAARAVYLMGGMLYDSQRSAGARLLWTKSGMMFDELGLPDGIASMETIRETGLGHDWKLCDEMLPKVKSGALSADELVRMFIEDDDLSRDKHRSGD